MVSELALRFLGTSSQTGLTRNYSSLLVKYDHHTIMVDCGESTQRQLQQRHIGGEERLNNIRNILITHLHADHVLGLVPLLCTLMGPSNANDGANAEKRPRVEIFGPSGLRALVRTTLTTCYTTLSGFYTVHELLWPQQQAMPTTKIVEQNKQSLVERADTPLPGAVNGPARTLPNLPQHENELPGKDLRMDQESLTWTNITDVAGMQISAAPILHRCPAVGYIFQEPRSPSQGLSQSTKEALDRNADALRTEQGIKNPASLIGRLLKKRETLCLPDGTVLEPPALDVPGRKIVILGDTFDASIGQIGAGPPRGVLKLAQDADVLVHECTNVALPGRLLAGKKREDEQQDQVRQKAMQRGHSTPQVAGQFAGRIGAKQLIMNHFSIKYPAASSFASSQLASGTEKAIQSGPHNEAERKWHVMREIERQATQTWHTELSQSHAGRKEDLLTRSALAAYDGMLYRVSSSIEDEEQNRSLPTEKSNNGSNLATYPIMTYSDDKRVKSSHSRNGPGRHARHAKPSIG